MSREKDRFSRLRQRALEVLDSRRRTEAEEFGHDLRSLLSELDTYRVELEIQNEDLRRAQLELARSERKYSELFELAPVGYLCLDDKGRIVQANSRAGRMLGLAGKDLAGGKFSRHIHFDDQDVFHLLRRKLKMPGDSRTCTLRLQKEDGTLVHVQLEAMISTASEEMSCGLLLTLTDIGPLQRATEEATRLNEELERRVEERTRELQEAMSQLLHSEKLSAIGSLAASIAHELNNPLQGVLNILKGVGRRAAFEPEDGELMEVAVGECKRMRKLLQALQDFNRPTSAIRAPMDLHAILDSVLLLLGKELARQGIVVDRSYDRNIPRVYGVGDQIKQVIMNILANSVDACRTGDRIDVATRAEDHRVVIEIADSGAGIDADHLPRIFEPFFSTKAEVRGTGLGLSVSHGIIKNHKGEIEVDSSPGKGSCFRIRLPVRSPDRKD